MCLGRWFTREKGTTSSVMEVLCPRMELKYPRWTQAGAACVYQLCIHMNAVAKVNPFWDQQWLKNRHTHSSCIILLLILLTNKKNLCLTWSVFFCPRVRSGWQHWRYKLPVLEKWPAERGGASPEMWVSAFALCYIHTNVPRKNWPLFWYQLMHVSWLSAHGKIASSFPHLSG